MAWVCAVLYIMFLFLESYDAMWMHKETPVLFSFNQTCLYTIYDMIYMYVVRRNVMNFIVNYFIVNSLPLSLVQMNISPYNALISKLQVAESIHCA